MPKKPIFIAQVNADSLRIISCLPYNYLNGNIKFYAQALDTQTSLNENITRIFKELGYNRNPLVISLPRSSLACRYVKIPAQREDEITKIIALQAPRFLPYPAEELITGFQLLNLDKEGFSHLNQVIAHKDVIERNIGLFKGLRPEKISILPNYYGICNLYNLLNPQETKTVLVAEFDKSQAELIIIKNRKCAFSRAFRFSQGGLDSQGIFTDEINKTISAYLKESNAESPQRVVFFCKDEGDEKFCSGINAGLNIGFELLPYIKMLKLNPQASASIINSGFSYCGLIGLGLRQAEESLNLLPFDLKKENYKNILWGKYLKQAVLTCVIIFMFSLGTAKIMDNKNKQLLELKAELNNVTKEARPLEALDKKLKFLKDSSKSSFGPLNILYDLNRIIPDTVSLSSFTYEEEGGVVLRGRVQELKEVFSFVTQLEKAPAFKGFNIKVRYATKKKIQAGEIVDFEVACAKRKVGTLSKNAQNP